MVLVTLFFLINLIQFSLEQDTSECAKIIPKTPEDCYAKHSLEKACCFHTIYGGTNHLGTFCGATAIEFYPNDRILPSYGFTFDRKCGDYLQKFPVMENVPRCGVDKPVSPLDCFMSHGYESNCCFYKAVTPYGVFTKCFAPGSYTQYIKYRNEHEGNVYYVDCQASYLAFNNSLLNSIFFMLIFIILL